MAAMPSRDTDISLPGSGPSVYSSYFHPTIRQSGTGLSFTASLSPCTGELSSSAPSNAPSDALSSARSGSGLGSGWMITIEGRWEGRIAKAISEFTKSTWLQPLVSWTQPKPVKIVVGADPGTQKIFTKTSVENRTTHASGSWKSRWNDLTHDEISQLFQQKDKPIVDLMEDYLRWEIENQVPEGFTPEEEKNRKRTYATALERQQTNLFSKLLDLTNSLHNESR